MSTIIQEHYILSGLIIVLFILSLLSQAATGFLYQNMIKETHNMSSTENKMLKICKLKFTNYYELHEGVSNIPVFVEKFMHSIRIGRFSLKGLYHLSGQLLLFAIFTAGTGACRAIAANETLDKIVPYYVGSFFMLYIFFAVAAIIDIKGKRMILKTNLIDYLENVMSIRIPQTRKEQDRLDKLEAENLQKAEKEEKTFFWKRKERGRNTPAWDKLTAEEEAEMESLLQEFIS